jgi:hypothetical protein
MGGDVYRGGGKLGKRGGGGHAAGASRGSESDRRVGDDGRDSRGHDAREIMLD